jgi:hypothetical protein
MACRVLLVAGAADPAALADQTGRRVVNPSTARPVPEAA